MARKRQFSTFSLSFLDIMSCGLGAVALIFLIIKHETNVKVEEQHKDLQAEVNLLEEEVTDGQAGLVKIRNTLSDVDMQLVQADGLARRIQEDIDTIRDKIRELEDDDTDQQIKELEAQLKILAEQKKELEDELKKGNDMRRIAGTAERQYLTGMKLGGKRILILLDSSASMLDATIVNVIRRRNMSDDTKRAAEKWQRALAAVDWLVSQFPEESYYQIYTFNTKVNAVIEDTKDEWLPIGDEVGLEQAIINMRQVIPQRGTSLELAFQSVSGLSPLPDNIFLITDGLPTQGITQPKRATISGPDRLRLYEQAKDALPPSIPVNVLLWPMEGDPMAASAFWKLAQFTRGSFMSPSKDWP